MKQKVYSMAMSLFRLSIPVLLLVFSFSPLFAAHPLVTDDTGTQGAGRFQLEVTGELGDDEKGGLKETTGEASATLSYGIADNVDLVLSMPFMWYRIKENGLVLAEEDGPGDLAFEVKWRFFEYEDRGLSIAFKPGLTLPTGDDNKGLGNGKVSGGGTLIVSKEGVLGALYLNLAYTRNEYGLQEDALLFRNDIWQASFAGQINITADMTGVWDIGLQTNPEKGAEQHPAFMLGGLIYSVTEDFDVGAGVKWGLNDQETDTTWLTGITLRF